MSTDAIVLRDLPVDAVTTPDTSTDLREATWTRFGSDTVRGDAATEATLSGLAGRSREAARAQGYAAGWAEGRRGALARAHDEQDSLVRAFEDRSRRALAAQQSAADALTAAVRNTQTTTRTLQGDLAEQALDLALQIAEVVLGRELELAGDPAADALRRALRTIPGDVAVVARLHPDDLDALDRSVLADRPATYVADPTVSRGDAVVETDSCVIDAGVAAALARVREVLGR
jgi:flagellar assembly protein FliH